MNDGYFDTWKILGMNNSYYTSVTIQIFDIFGKIIALINQKNDDGWGGTYKGKSLPSED